MRLHFADQSFTPTDDEDPAELAQRIETAIRNRGGWVDIMTTRGGISIMAAPGVPIWLDRRKDEQVVPQRLRP